MPDEIEISCLKDLREHLESEASEAQEINIDE